MLALFPKTYAQVRDKSAWNAEMSTRALSKTTKDTAQAFASLPVVLCTKVNGEMTSPKAMEFFTLAKMKSLKEDLTREWFPTANLSKLFWLMAVTMKATTATIRDTELECATIPTGISTRDSGLQTNESAEAR